MIDKEGRIDNKSDLEIYFSLALSKYPNLYFQFFDVLTGTDSVIISYRSIDQRIAAEFMQFDENGKINFVRAHFIQHVNRSIACNIINFS
jgi:predicted ester cyclase